MTRALALAAVLLPALAAANSANLYYWPVGNTNVSVCAYKDDGGKDWRCGGNYYSNHKGTDIAVGVGTDVYAAAAGTVNDRVDGCPYGAIGSTCGGGFGNHVALFHGSGDESIYGHLSSGSGIPAKDASVGCGARIGGSGSSGNSSGPHLHFESRVGVTQSSYYSGSADDPFAGSCGGPTSYWKSQGSGYSAGCGSAAPTPASATGCAGPTCPAGTYAVWTCNAAKTSRTRCLNGNVETQACAYGCKVNATGVDDECLPPPPCPAGTSATWACNAAKTERTRCTNGNVETEACPNGCDDVASGDDVCRVCPVGTFSTWTCSADHTRRSRCTTGAAETEACAFGCAVSTPGQDDTCQAQPACAAGETTAWTCDAARQARARCFEGAAATEACPNGCKVVADADDVCSPACPPGVGSSWACSADLSSRRRCVDGVVESDLCPSGCVAGSGGAGDACGVLKCPSTVGEPWTCTNDAAARMHCEGGDVLVEACAAGCADDGGGAVCPAPAPSCSGGEPWTCAEGGVERVRCVAGAEEREPCAGCAIVNGEAACGQAAVEAHAGCGCASAAAPFGCVALLGLAALVRRAGRRLTPR